MIERYKASQAREAFANFTGVWAGHDPVEEIYLRYTDLIKKVPNMRSLDVDAGTSFDHCEESAARMLRDDGFQVSDRIIERYRTIRRIQW